MSFNPWQPARGLLIAIALTTIPPTAIESTHAASPDSLLSGFSRTRGIIETSMNICILLDLYLADSPQQQSQGLMYIRKLEEFEGMLFRYSPPARITMWMKNTYVPLDMLFIRADGSIAGIARNTEPLSLRRITAPEDVPGVLELNAGFAERWDVRPGNRLLSIN